MQKISLFAALVLLTVIGAGTAHATDIFNKTKKTSTTPQVKTMEMAPRPTPESVGTYYKPDNTQIVLPPNVQLMQEGVVPMNLQPCTEQDQKLVKQVDEKVLAKRDPSASSAETSADAKGWNDALGDRPTVQNLVGLYVRCASVVSADRAARGIKPREPTKLPPDLKVPEGLKMQ